MQLSASKQTSVISPVREPDR